MGGVSSSFAPGAVEAIVDAGARVAKAASEQSVRRHQTKQLQRSDGNALLDYGEGPCSLELSRAKGVSLNKCSAPERCVWTLIVDQ